MALVRCPDCGRDVSSEAPACLGCGRPMKSGPAPAPVAAPVTPPPEKASDDGQPLSANHRISSSKIGAIVLGLLALILIFASVRQKRETAGASSSETPITSLVPTPRWDAIKSKGAAEVLLKNTLRDPDSYRRIGWTRYGNDLAEQRLPDKYEVWRLQYRAKNGFGGYDVGEQMYLFSPDSGPAPYPEALENIPPTPAPETESEKREGLARQKVLDGLSNPTNPTQADIDGLRRNAIRNNVTMDGQHKIEQLVYPNDVYIYLRDGRLDVNQVPDVHGR